jgi:hypothetical protein
MLARTSSRRAGRLLARLRRSVRGIRGTRQDHHVRTGDPGDVLAMAFSVSSCCGQRGSARDSAGPGSAGELQVRLVSRFDGRDLQPIPHAE